jgi:hypothetical protein
LLLSDALPRVGLPADDAVEFNVARLFFPRPPLAACISGDQESSDLYAEAFQAGSDRSVAFNVGLISSSGSPGLSVYFGLVLRVLALRRTLGVGDALTFDDALTFFGGPIGLPSFAGGVGFGPGGRLPGQQLVLYV